MTFRLSALFACIVAAGFMVSCAPRLPDVARIETAELQRRYLVQLADRDAASSGVDADLNLWLTHDGRREPGLEAVLLMAGPDRLRLRIGALFGTAVDAGVDGDEVRTYVPRVKGVWDTDAAGPPMEFADAGEWLVRAWSATWRPPAEAWTSATWRDSLLRLRWAAGAESLLIGVGASGLPREVTLQRGEHDLRIVYEGWRIQDGRAWPDRIRCHDLDRTFELRARLRIMWFREIQEDRLVPSVPEDARALTWEDVRELLYLEEP